jgi:hypothetical protein
VDGVLSVTGRTSESGRSVLKTPFRYDTLGRDAAENTALIADVRRLRREADLASTAAQLLEGGHDVRDVAFYVHLRRKQIDKLRKLEAKS